MDDSDQSGRPSGSIEAERATAERNDVAHAQCEPLAEVTPELTWLATVLTRMPIGVIVVEAESGRVLVMNAEAERLARPPAQTTSAQASLRRELPSDALVEHGGAVRPDDWPLARALRSGHTTINQEMRYLREDGSIGTVLVSAAPIRDADRMVAAVTTFNDVTDLRNAQARLSDDLRQLSLKAERGRQEADSASAAKSDFLSTMSHEIRTPLNAIVGYVQLLEMGVGGVGTAAQKSYLQRLRMSSDHLLKLVNDVLDLAKAESSSLTLHQAAGSCDAAIETAIALVLPLATARQINLEHPSYAIREDIYVGDEDRVHQILVNLLGNAMKFTRPGGTVTIESGIVSNPHTEDSRVRALVVREGLWATITVTDTGIGIPANRLTAIFEPFVQLEEARDAAPSTPAQRGTGLGLAISRRLACAMGGDLTVRSVEGQGSAFTLWLPAERDVAASG